MVLIALVSCLGTAFKLLPVITVTISCGIHKHFHVYIILKANVRMYVNTKKDST